MDKQEDPYEELKDIWAIAFKDAVNIMQEVDLALDAKVCLEIAKTLVTVKMQIEW